jgi:arylsulfatase A-like enzyme
LLGLAWVALGIPSTSCTKEAPEPPAIEVVKNATMLDLVADLPFAWIDRELPVISMLHATHQRRLSQGWLGIQRTKSGQGLVWARGRSSVVELTILQPVDRLLTLQVAPTVAPAKLPQQSLSILWNGEPLERFDLDWKLQRLRLQVPAELQRSGLNRLELRPRYWISPARARIASADEEISFQLRSIEIESELSVPAPAQAGASARRGANGGHSVIQECGSSVSWFYWLPKDARLRGSIRLEHGDAPKPNEPGSAWTLALTDAGGAQRVIAERSWTNRDPSHEVQLDVDLSSVTGVVALESILATTEGRTGPCPSIELERLRIEGFTYDTVMQTGAPPERTHVLVVLFDTLRADSLGAYGNEQAKTPFIDRLAASGVTFMNTASTASWTKPAIASLWTGLHPTSHGVEGPESSLPAAVPYLPDVLRGAGYRTLSVSGNPYYSATFGFDRGFDEMIHYYLERDRVLEQLTSPEAQADAVWERFLEPALEHGDGKPVFAVLHEIDPHFPYQPPAPYDELFDSGHPADLESWNTLPEEQLLLMLQAASQYGRWLKDEDVRALRGRYDGEVSAMDAYLGRLIAHLDRAGLRERTLLVFISDHGEQFFEHGGWGHGASAYEEELRIPFILSLPGTLPEGRRLETPVSIVDVAPTVLEILGIPQPHGQHGRSLLSEMHAPSLERTERAIYAQSNIRLLDKDAPNARVEMWHSVRRGKWKLLRRKVSTRARRYDYELYDLSRDPAEQSNRWSREPIVGHALRLLLERQLFLDREAAPKAAPPAQLTPEAKRELRALGYAE